MTDHLVPAEGVPWAPLPMWAPELLRDNGADHVTQAGYLQIWGARDHRTGIARLSRDELAKRLGVGATTARRVTRHLETWGLIRREDKATGGRGVWAGYYLALDGPHVFAFRVNRVAVVTRVRGPRPDPDKPVAPPDGNPSPTQRPLVPSAVPAPVDNPSPTLGNPSPWGDGYSEETRRPGVTGIGQNPSPWGDDTRHIEEEQEEEQQQNGRATTAEGGATGVPDAAAAEGMRTKKPVAADPFNRELQTALGRDWIALAELVATFGAAGVLPLNAEADRLTRQSFDAGWTAAAMVDLIGQRLARPGIVNDGGYVLTILRNMPEPPATPDAPTRPPCGRCVVPGRWVPDENGYPSTVHCPDCWKDAETAEIPATSPTRPSDAVTGMAEGFFAGLPRQGVLGPSGGRTHELAATGSEG